MFCLCGHEVLPDGMKNAGFDNANKVIESAIIFRQSVSHFILGAANAGSMALFSSRMRLWFPLSSSRPSRYHE
jgi:hypothetical protein